MADQALAERSALKELITRKPSQEYTLRYKLAWRWRVSCCWTRYALDGAYRGVPGLVNFVLGNHFFTALQVPSELTALGTILAARRPECALEIGTAYGGTLLFLSRLASPRATIVSVDLPGEKVGGGYSARRQWFYRRFARRRQRLHLLRGDSHSRGTLSRVKAAFGSRSLDYLFIDGDHTYEGVKRDFELYAPLVHKGAIIAFHDIVEHPPAVGCEVSRFWNEIKHRYPHTEIVGSRNQGWGGIGVLYVV